MNLYEFLIDETSVASGDMFIFKFVLQEESPPA